MKIMSGVFLLPFLLGGCGEKSESPKTLVLATSADNPPYEFFSSEKHEIVGFDIDLARKMAEELGETLEVKDMDFNSLIPALNAGRADMAMAAMTVTNERQKAVDFSDVYVEAKAGMLFLKAREDQMQKSEDFQGKKVGAQTGSAHEHFLKDVHEKSPHFEIVSRNKIGELVQELKSHRIDAVVMDEKPALEHAKLDAALGARSVESSYARLAIALKKGSEKKEKINQALKALRDRGEIERLRQKWFK